MHVAGGGTRPDRLDARKLAVTIDVAGKHHLHGALLHGIRRRFTPQQVIAQRLGTAVGQAHWVLVDDIGKDAVVQGKRALGEQVVADHHDLTRFAGRNERIGHQLGAHGEHAADELGGIRTIKAVLELPFELLDLGMSAGKILDLSGDVMLAQVIMAGAGG